ncbi:hypothetical protein [Acinetobacter sp. YH12124]|uniref:hypothetical protein n=1 Tax=Acinetobacter sp. YH12124 TaxID=2601109 RepID=UPI0015D1E1D3|nr:hypothetical protein [Acinetobacter sp. YH12124]
MLENNTSSDIDGDNNNVNIAKRDINIHQSIMNSEPRPSSIQRLLEGIADLETLDSVAEPDTLPYTIEDKIKHNKLIEYLEDIDELIDWKYNISKRLSFLELNGFPGTQDKVISFVRRKWRKFKFEFPDNPDQIISAICNDIESELKQVINSKLNHEDISYTTYVVFYVFAECKIFEKPPC